MPLLSPPHPHPLPPAAEALLSSVLSRMPPGGAAALRDYLDRCAVESARGPVLRMMSLDALALAARRFEREGNGASKQHPDRAFMFHVNSLRRFVPCADIVTSGRCKWGTKCFFAHPDSFGGFPGAVQGEEAFAIELGPPEVRAERYAQLLPPAPRQDVPAPRDPAAPRAPPRQDAPAPPRTFPNAPPGVSAFLSSLPATSIPFWTPCGVPLPEPGHSLMEHVLANLSPAPRADLCEFLSSSGNRRNGVHLQSPSSLAYAVARFRHGQYGRSADKPAKIFMNCLNDQRKFVPCADMVAGGQCRWDSKQWGCFWAHPNEHGVFERMLEAEEDYRRVLGGDLLPPLSPPLTSPADTLSNPGFPHAPAPSRAFLNSLSPESLPMACLAPPGSDALWLPPAAEAELSKLEGAVDFASLRGRSQVYLETISLNLLKVLVSNLLGRSRAGDLHNPSGYFMSVYNGLRYCSLCLSMLRGARCKLGCDCHYVCYGNCREDGSFDLSFPDKMDARGALLLPPDGAQPETRSSPPRAPPETRSSPPRAPQLLFPRAPPGVSAYLSSLPHSSLPFLCPPYPHPLPPAGAAVLDGVISEMTPAVADALQSLLDTQTRPFLHLMSLSSLALAAHNFVRELPRFPVKLGSERMFMSIAKNLRRFVPCADLITTGRCTLEKCPWAHPESDGVFPVMVEADRVFRKCLGPPPPEMDAPAPAPLPVDRPAFAPLDRPADRPSFPYAPPDVLPFVSSLSLDSLPMWSLAPPGAPHDWLPAEGVWLVDKVVRESQMDLTRGSLPNSRGGGLENLSLNALRLVASEMVRTPLDTPQRMLQTLFCDFRKSSMCPKLLRAGRCTWGGKCHYAHPEDGVFDLHFVTDLNKRGEPNQQGGGLCGFRPLEPLDDVRAPPPYHHAPLPVLPPNSSSISPPPSPPMALPVGRASSPPLAAPLLLHSVSSSPPFASSPPRAEKRPAPPSPPFPNPKRSFRPPLPEARFVLVERMDTVTPAMLKRALDVWPKLPYLSVAMDSNSAVIEFESGAVAAECMRLCRYGQEEGVAFVRIQERGVDRDLVLNHLNER
ncbi:hypothetical protein TeGR_g6141 [Tetraparma gracilis]|uniref:C3H1-type domain-containing protein n=1 Tax=Tetraparma gracilis TaxID=2962635 RepID=A0ABQ6N099_9STRA|nr:hypothetical protein TeGR_g6141 [Tetraparma gracilis]